MAVSFIEKIKNMKMSEFTFVHFEKLMTSGQSEEGERKPYLLFTLETPIERVTSTTWLFDPNFSTEKLHPFEEDVVEVRCMLEDVEKYESEFKFEEDDKGVLTRRGSYSGDMILDLSKTKNVWLTDEPFNKRSSDWRNSKRAKEYDRLRGSILGSKKGE